MSDIEITAGEISGVIAALYERAERRDHGAEIREVQEGTPSPAANMMRRSAQRSRALAARLALAVPDGARATWRARISPAPEGESAACVRGRTDEPHGQDVSEPGPFETWAASEALYDFPMIADGDRERIYIRAADARALLARAFAAGREHGGGRIPGAQPENLSNSLVTCIDTRSHMAGPDGAWQRQGSGTGTA